MRSVQVWGYVGSVVVRLLLIFSSGILHPDEFFQSQEVLATSIFQLNSTTVPWEYNSERPNRSVVMIGIFIGIPYWIMAQLEKNFGVQIDGTQLLYWPRFILFLFSFLIDVSIVKIAKACQQAHYGALMVFSTAWPALFFASRPFSNTMEMLVFAISLLMLATPIHNGQKILKTRSLYLGCVLSIGFFTRFTFLFFFLPIGMFLCIKNDNILNEILSKKSEKGVSTVVPVSKRISWLFNVSLWQGLLGFLFTSSFFVFFDTLFFTGNFKFFQPNTWIISPLNNLQYNSNLENLALHGIHPRYTHAVVNMSLFFGPMWLFFCWKMVILFHHYFFSSQQSSGFKQRHYQTNNSDVELRHFNVFLASCILVPLLLLSFAPHQEARFLLPLLVPLSLFCGLNNFFLTNNGTLRRKFCFLWILFNGVVVVFYGVVHQAGVVPMLLSIPELPRVSHPQSSTIVVFYHTYMPPGFLMKRKNNAKEIALIDLAGANQSVLCKNLRDLPFSPHNRLFLVHPGSISPNCKFIKSVLVHRIGPHLSTEDLPLKWNEVEFSLHLVQLEKKAAQD